MDNESEMYEKLTELFENYLDEDLIRTFKTGGYYSM